MSKNFRVWRYKNIAGMVTLYRLENVDDPWRLTYAEPLAADWPDDATFKMHPERKRDTILTDSLYNMDSVVVASRKLVEFLQARKIPKVEYLPVTVLDHKKKPTKTPFSIVHSVAIVPCVDVRASGGTADDVDPEALSGIKRLAIDEARVPPELEIFRPREDPPTVLVRKALADAIDAAGFAGPRWVEPLKYPE